MKRILLSTICCAALLTGCQPSTRQTAAEDLPRVVADQLYYAGQEGNKAYLIFGKFHTRKDLVEYLRLDTQVGIFKERTWTLADIVVSIDLNANGEVAQWCVSGPAPLIDKYLLHLRNLYDAKKVFYDFGASIIDVKPTAYWENKEE